MAYPFDCFPFLLRNADGLGAWWHRRIFVAGLIQKLEELVRVLADELCELRVAGSDLLQNGLQHLRRVLHHLTELLELRVISEEVEVAETGGRGAISTCCCCCCSRASACTSGQRSKTGSGSATGSGPCCSSATSAPTGLCGGFEQIDRLVARVAGWSCGWVGGSCRSRSGTFSTCRSTCALSGLGRLSLFLLNVLGDALSSLERITRNG